MRQTTDTLILFSLHLYYFKTNKFIMLFALIVNSLPPKEVSKFFSQGKFIFLKYIYIYLFVYLFIYLFI